MVKLFLNITVKPIIHAVSFSVCFSSAKVTLKQQIYLALGNWVKI